MAVGQLILTDDVGTSALKAVVYSRRGRVVASSSQRYSYQTPHAGWAEADPESWWQALEKALDDLRALPLELQKVQVVALTGQMRTAVLLMPTAPSSARPCSGSIAAPPAETAELRRAWACPPTSYTSTYTLPKLYWLTRHEPGLFGRVAHILWPKDYLRYRLTGEYLTDYTEAAGAALLDWDTLNWAGRASKMIGLDPALLPPLRQPHEEAGLLRPQVAARFGLSKDVRIIVGAGDVLALITGAPPMRGQVTCSLRHLVHGVSTTAARHTVADSENRLSLPFVALLPARRHLLNDQGRPAMGLAGIVRSRPGFEEAVAQGMPDAGQHRGPAFLFAFSIRRDAVLSGTTAWQGRSTGLTLAHRRPQFMRAVLEGVAFSLRYLLDIFAELGAAPKTITLAGGGAGVAGWPQIFADVCHLPVRIFADQETVTAACAIRARHWAMTSQPRSPPPLRRP